MEHLLNWWSLHHHIKRQEEHNNMLLLPDIVLFCPYVIAPSKYNGQVKTLFSSLSLRLIRSQCLLGVLVLWYFALMRLLPYTSANYDSMQSSCTKVLFRPVIDNKRTNRHICITLRPVSVVALPILSFGAFRPDRLQAFRLRYTARLQCLC